MVERERAWGGVPVTSAVGAARGATVPDGPGTGQAPRAHGAADSSDATSRTTQVARRSGRLAASPNLFLSHVLSLR